MKSKFLVTMVTVVILSLGLNTESLQLTIVESAWAICFCLIFLNKGQE